MWHRCVVVSCGMELLCGVDVDVWMTLFNIVWIKMWPKNSMRIAKKKFHEDFITVSMGSNLEIYMPGVDSLQALLCKKKLKRERLPLLQRAQLLIMAVSRGQPEMYFDLRVKSTGVSSGI